MAVVIARHGERSDYVDREAFVKSTQFQERPWDPLLTETGRKQAGLMAARVQKELVERDFPPVTRVFASPFIRTVETAEEACKVLGIDTIHVENGMVEALCEEWFRSWAVPGADTTWGGPKHSRCGVPVATSDIDPRAMKGPSAWLLTPEELKARVSPLVSLTYEPHICFQDNITWETPETMTGDTAARCAETVRGVARRYPNETVLFLSHSGPAQNMYAKLTEDPKIIPCDYTGVFMFKPKDAEHKEPYEGLLKGCSEHIR